MKSYLAGIKKLMKELSNNLSTKSAGDTIDSIAAYEIEKINKEKALEEAGLESL